MSPIDVESNPIDENDKTPIPENVELVKYRGIDKKYGRFMKDGELWIQREQAEHMLDVGNRQFERYCDDPALIPKVEKIRRLTKHYSYIFVKESDVKRIAELKGRRLLLLDEEKEGDDKDKIGLSDAKELVKKLFNEQAPDFIKKEREKSELLLVKNESLTNEVINLTKETTNLKIKNNNKNLFLIITAIIIVASGGVAFYLYNDNNSLNQDNDKYIATHKQDSLAIINLNTDDSIQKAKVKDLTDENEILKRMIPSVQNEEINAVKKD